MVAADMIFPQQWKKERPNYLRYMPLVPIPSLKAIQLESQAASSWKGTCDRLSNISKPTLVIVGTDDVIIPTAYSTTSRKDTRSMACADKRRRSWSYVSISTTICINFRNFSFSNVVAEGL